MAIFHILYVWFVCATHFQMTSMLTTLWSLPWPYGLLRTLQAVVFQKHILFQPVQSICFTDDLNIDIGNYFVLRNTILGASLLSTYTCTWMVQELYTTKKKEVRRKARFLLNSVIYFYKQLHKLFKLYSNCSNCIPLSANFPSKERLSVPILFKNQGLTTHVNNTGPSHYGVILIICQTE